MLFNMRSVAYNNIESNIDSFVIPDDEGPFSSSTSLYKTLETIEEKLRKEPRGFLFM